jgi:hypothetical protein
VVAHFKTHLRNLWGLGYKEMPDSDNVYKAVTDALFEEDKGIYGHSCFEYWGPEDKIELKFIGLMKEPA